MELITVKTFEYPQEGYIIKNKLEQEGVFVFLKDELTIQSDNFLSNAVGGVKLQVFEKDVEKAKQIIDLFKVDNELGKYILIIKKTELLYCPKCSSLEVKQNNKLSWLFVAFFFIGLPLLFSKKEYHCFDCYIDFKVKYLK